MKANSSSAMQVTLVLQRHSLSRNVTQIKIIVRWLFNKSSEANSKLVAIKPECGLT